MPVLCGWLISWRQGQVVIADEEKVTIAIEKLGSEKPVVMDAGIMKISQRAAEQANIRYKKCPAAQVMMP